MVLLILSGCGWAEWPPAQGPVSRTNYVKPPTSAKPASSGVFINADAVTVARGDTVYILSRRHKVSMRAIIAANGLRPPYYLKIGQRVVLPRDHRHVVRRGDTLYSVSRHYAIDTYTLARANAIKPPYTIIVGQSLRIPAAFGELVQKSTPLKSTPLKKAKNRKVAKKTFITAKHKPRPVAIPQPPPKSAKGFLWPVKGKVLSSFGPKSRGLHNDGINISARRGSDVKAAQNGVVAYAGNELRGFGNLLLVKHAGGWITAYAHNADLLVKRGQKVRRGQVIARVGSSGSVSRAQLHFEIRKGNRAMNPIKYLG